MYQWTIVLAERWHPSWQQPEQQTTQIGGCSETANEGGKTAERLRTPKPARQEQAKRRRDVQQPVTLRWQVKSDTVEEHTYFDLPLL